jgi:hypothetical protein
LTTGTPLSDVASWVVAAASIDAAVGRDPDLHIDLDFSASFHRRGAGASGHERSAVETVRVDGDRLAAQTVVEVDPERLRARKRAALNARTRHGLSDGAVGHEQGELDLCHLNRRGVGNVDEQRRARAEEILATEGRERGKDCPGAKTE